MFIQIYDLFYIYRSESERTNLLVKVIQYMQTNMLHVIRLFRDCYTLKI